MSDSTNAITIANPERDPEWNQIVDQLLEEVDRLPEQVVEATELLVNGWPIHKVAKDVGSTSKEIRLWLQKYPTMALAVANGRKMLQKWRMSQLEQQFVLAVRASQEILSLDNADKDVNAKLVATKAQQARYIIGLFAGQQVDVNIKLPEQDQVLKAKADALDYIAQQLAAQRGGDEPIEATYTVVSADAAAQAKPLLDAEGKPFYGELGVLDVNDEGILCHICGKRANWFHLHVGNDHNMTVKDYELTFMLELGSIMKVENTDEPQA